MLHEFLKTNRAELIERCRTKVAKRGSPPISAAEEDRGIPLFLDQLAEMLPGGRNEEGIGNPSGEAGAKSAATAQMEEGAAQHGRELRRANFNLEQVVHGYGDLCQAITQLAAERGEPITVHEFGTLNIRLDNAIAEAVTEFSREFSVRESHAIGAAVTINSIGHEMRNLHATITIALQAIERGSVGFASATAGAMKTSLVKMGLLIQRSIDMSEPPKG